MQDNTTIIIITRQSGWVGNDWISRHQRTELQYIKNEIKMDVQGLPKIAGKKDFRISMTILQNCKEQLVVVSEETTGIFGLVIIFSTFNTKSIGN